MDSSNKLRAIAGEALNGELGLTSLEIAQVLAAHHQHVSDSIKNISSMIPEFRAIPCSKKMGLPRKQPTRLLRIVTRESRFFLSSLGFFLFGVFLYLLKDFNIIPGNTITRNSVLIGSAIEIIGLSIGLADRINILRECKKRLEIENVTNDPKKIGVRNALLQASLQPIKRHIVEKTRFTSPASSPCARLSRARSTTSRSDCRCAVRASLSLLTCRMHSHMRLRQNHYLSGSHACFT